MTPSHRPDRLPTVSFVVPVRDDAANLRRCLETIRLNDYPSELVEILVADNGSRDGSAAVARAAGATVVACPDLKVAAVRNSAAAVSRGDVIAFVDADHAIASDWLRHAVDALRCPAVAAVGSLYEAPPQGTWVQRSYDRMRRRRDGVHETEWLASGNLAMWRKAFREEGGFDESLETCEDVDLCRRLRVSGHKVISDARVRSIHFGDPATLAALFRGELWRGRDNLRASLRGSLTFGAIPSVAIPVANLIALVSTALGVAALPVAGPWPAAAAAIVLPMLAIPRAGRMLSGLDRVALADAIQAYIVACVYDAARALALVSRGGYRIRRALAPEAAR